MSLRARLLALASVSFASVAYGQTETPVRPADPLSIPIPVRYFHYAGTPQSNTIAALPREHLFGDWLGVRTRLEDQGITPTLTFVSDMLGNPVGGKRQAFTECDNLGLNVVADLDKLYGIAGGQFHVSISQRSGTSLTREYIGNTFNVQQVFGGETFRVVDVDYTQKIGNDAAEFRVGRIAAGDDFLVSVYDYIFVQNGFDGNPVAIFLNAPGMTAYPNATWGARLRVNPSERTYIMAGIYNGDPTIRDNGDHGMNLSVNGPAFAIAEAAYKANGLEGDNGMIGNYKIGAYFNGGDFTTFAGQTFGAAGLGQNATVRDGNYGFYALADQIFFRPDGLDSHRALGVFGSITVAPDQSINQMPFFLTGGLGARGLLASRPDDFAGFGILFGEFSSDLRQAQRIAQRFDPAVGVQTYELVFEWTYGIRLGEGRVIVQPDFQYIINPGGTGRIHDAFVLGMQLAVNF